MKVIILLIEGKKTDHPSFFSGLIKKGFQVDSAPSGSAALEYLAVKMPNLVLVDAASMRSNGRRICQAVRKNAKGVPIVLMVDEDFTNLNNISADVVLIQPFTLQKLLNRIKPLLPIEQKDMLQVGDFRLDLEQRWVVVQNHQVRLTPRLVALLKTLLEHPGQLIERNDLFSMVWEADYAGGHHSVHPNSGEPGLQRRHGPAGHQRRTAGGHGRGPDDSARLAWRSRRCTRHIDVLLW